MANFHMLWMVIYLSIIIVLGFYSSSVEGKLDTRIRYNWGAKHSNILDTEDDDATLLLDQTSGSGVESNSLFLFGSIEMLIKLVPGNSAGTVTAFYVYSSGNKHDEIDFEFLGNISGQPYTINTNIFTQGGGGREQQFKPWFDPSADFHNYTIHWNPSHVVWYVDDIPIRVYKNYENETIPYPNRQAMRVYASIWNADSWATRGGLVKIDWKKAPFIAKLRSFRARACNYGGSQSISECGESTPFNWWSSEPYSQLTTVEQDHMKSIRKNYMIYDYCKDVKRFRGLFPGECFKPHY